MSKPNQKGYNLVLDKVTQENGGQDDVFEVIFFIDPKSCYFHLKLMY